MKAKLGWSLALVGIACALNPPPVPVEGPSRDVSALVGEWTGEYHSVETGRSGSIWFKLEAGRDTALGDVVMVPVGAVASHNAPMGAEQHMAAARQSQALTIRFVRVSGGLVTGTIDLYPSPDCECVLLTRFEGEQKGNRISGSFTIHHSGHDSAPQKGTWWVERKKTP